MPHYNNKMKIGLLFLFGLLLCSRNTQAIVVSNANELVDAIVIANQGGDKEILLKDGTYTLDDMLWISANGVTIQSQSGNRQDVIVRGRGMYGGVSHIFNVPGSDFTVKDMTIGWVSNHAIQIHGNNNSSNTLISNLHIVDTYEQMVKISYNPSSSNSSKNGIMGHCLLEYSEGIGPQYYIGGIDGHQTKNWIIRNNIFKNIISPEDDVAEHAIHFWSGSENTLVEGNLIINCDRGIGFGLGDRGHTGGIIRNNMIVHYSPHTPFADVGIGLENAQNVQVCNNSIYFKHDYPNAIEYRFPGTHGGMIVNNLTNRSISQRDGGSSNLHHNITTAKSSWFKSINSGNLHLSHQVPQVIDKGATILGLTTDFDGDLRPQGSGIDIGADEYNLGETGPQSPENFRAQKKENRSLFLTEYIAILNWEGPQDTSNISGFRIYLSENSSLILLTEVDPFTFTFWHRGLNPNTIYRHAITSLSQNGQESLPVFTEIL
jgi:hypothetical protein